MAERRSGSHREHGGVQPAKLVEVVARVGEDGSATEMIAAVSEGRSEMVRRMGAFAIEVIQSGGEGELLALGIAIAAVIVALSYFIRVHPD